jgi:hypothetical protein
MREITTHVRGVGSVLKDYRNILLTSTPRGRDRREHNQRKTGGHRFRKEARQNNWSQRL